MKKSLLVLPALLSFALTACAGTDVTSKSDNNPAASKGDGKPAKAQGARATVGDTITLAGNESGLKLEVTVVKVVPSARPKDEFSTPEPGKRFAAVQIRLKNVGSVTYDDSPGNGAQLIDTEDQQYDEDLNDISLGTSIGTSVKLAPGSSRKGYLVFSVLKKARLSKFQFSLDSGFGPQTGEWLLK
ncbi:DUF4352 domain-containing protein [Actinomadura rayongensis]|uniref:DUF4352 domain-containing protein n=1 Tax=Actinomadura rayongensis TaxID=1429076 RepID=A0A6I4WBQ7_9ACTN|nr:DUF4352 domain-containing protein [Actinomadura rayongensis]MXQ65695.1 DUF4352 domain-containing protein [Actinomadura rayongensis]